MLARLIVGLWVALAPCCALAQGIMQAFPPGVFQNRAALSASVGPSQMVTPLLALNSSTAGPSTTAANYTGLFSGNSTSNWTANTTTGNRSAPIAVPGTISGFVVNFPTTLTTGQYVVALWHNSTLFSSSITCTITTSSSSCSSAGTEAVAAGDTIGWAVCPGTVSANVCTPSGTPTSQGAVQISAVFTGTNPGESFLISQGATGGNTNTVAQYAPFGGFMASYNSTESIVSSPMPTSGTIDHLYVTANSTAGTGKTTTVSIFHNGANSGVTCTISGTSSTTCNDLTDTFSVSAGDTISVEICPGTVSGGVCTPSGTPSSTEFKVSARWVPSTPGESVVFATNDPSSLLSATSTNWTNLMGAFRNVGPESNSYSYAPTVSGGFTIKKLTGVQTPQPGAGVTRTFNLRANGANVGSPSAMQCQMAAGTGASQTCSDATNSYGSIAGGTLIDLQSTVSGTNTALTSLRLSAVVTAP